jgi:hypothetical protein
MVCGLGLWFNDNLCTVFQVGKKNTFRVFRSPLALSEAAATLPGVHIKHDIIQNINRQEQLKD